MKEILFDLDMDERGLVLTIQKPDYNPNDFESYCNEIKLIKMIENMKVEWKKHCDEIIKNSYSDIFYDS